MLWLFAQYSQMLLPHDLSFLQELWSFHSSSVPSLTGEKYKGKEEGA